MIALLFAVILSASANFADTTCGQIKSSLAELRQVDYVKTLGMGMHSCTDTIFQMNGDGTLNATFSISSTVNTFYNETTGSLDSLYTSVFGSEFIKEYSDGKGDSCIVISGNSHFLESKDQMRGGRRSSWRAIGEYYDNKNKNLAAMQNYHVTPTGYILIRTELDPNTEAVTVIVLETCTNVD